MIRIIGLIAAIVLPLWNIPLIIRIVRRKSSKDVSLVWAIGVWICIVLMFPVGISSPEIVWRTYTVINTIFFSAVTVTVYIYRNGE